MAVGTLCWVPLRSRRRLHLACSLALVMVALAGCRPPQRDLRGLRGKYGGTLRLASQNDIRTLDTAIGYDTPSWRFERLIHECLLTYGEGADLQPAVARELPEVTAGRRFTFHLRHDVRFHHGRLVAAADFKYAIERLLDKRTKSPAAKLYSGLRGAQDYTAGRATEVTGLQCPDSHTLIVELDEPDMAFLNVLAMPFAAPLPREVVERYTDARTGLSTWPEHSVGCGPYRLTTWVRGQRIRVERFRGYWRTDVGYLDAVEQRFGIPEFMALMMFERGEIDLGTIPLPDFPRVMSDPRLRACVQSAPDNAIYYCSMNTELAPFGDRRVRQAFNYAIDKDRLARVLNGVCQPATGVLPPGMPGFNPDLRGYPHDPARARRLLAEAGYPDGLAVELATRSRPSEKPIAEALQEDLRHVGVKATLNPIAFPQWLDLSSRRGKMAFTINAWFQDYPDPSNFLDILLNGERITESNCNNRAFYNNPEVNRLLAAARGETDVARRMALYQQAEARIVDDAPWIFCYWPTRFVLVQPWVHGFRLHPVTNVRDEQLWLAPSDTKEPAQ